MGKGRTCSCNVPSLDEHLLYFLQFYGYVLFIPHYLHQITFPCKQDLLYFIVLIQSGIDASG